MRWKAKQRTALPRSCCGYHREEVSLFPDAGYGAPHYEVIDIGLPKKSRCGDLSGSMHFDSMTPQNGSAHLTGSLAAIDEENFLASKNRAATKQWWIIHNPTSETRASSLER